MEQSPQKSLSVDSTETCSYLATAPYDIYEHDHAVTSNADQSIAWWNCKITLDDAPIRGILEESEACFARNDTAYTQVVRGAALTHAWLCASALGTFVDFGRAYMQVNEGRGALAEVNDPLAEDATFQAFSAQIAKQAMCAEASDRVAVFTAAKVLCRGTLDLSIFPEVVDSPTCTNGGIYTFTPEQRMLIFAVPPGLEIWWRPGINRMSIDRQRPEVSMMNDFLEADSEGDPYAIVGQLLSKCVDMSQNPYGIEAT